MPDDGATGEGQRDEPREDWMRGNHLVDALPPEVAGRLRERGQVVPLRPGAVLEPAVTPEGHAHFPPEGALTLRTPATRGRWPAGAGQVSRS